MEIKDLGEFGLICTVRFNLHRHGTSCLQGGYDSYE